MDRNIVLPLSVMRRKNTDLYRCKTNAGARFHGRMARLSGLDEYRDNMDPPKVVMRPLSLHLRQTNNPQSNLWGVMTPITEDCTPIYLYAKLNVISKLHFENEAW